MKTSTRMKFCFSLLIALVLSTQLASAFLKPFFRNELLPRQGYHGVMHEVSFDSSQTVSRCALERRSSPLRMGIGDVFSKAFANEDMGPKKENPGLKSNLKWCMVTVNGKTVKAVQGQRLRDAIAATGAKIEYGCEKGDCGTCESLVDGKKIRVCKAIVPRNKDKINIKTKFG